MSTTMQELVDALKVARDVTGRNLSLPIRRGQVAVTEWHEENGDPYAREEIIVEPGTSFTEIRAELERLVEEDR